MDHKSSYYCELNIIWPRNSNPRAYYFQLSALYQNLSNHDGSQTEPLSVSWIQYDQEIPIPELTVVSCLQDNRFSETRNALQAKQLFVSWIQYGWSTMIWNQNPCLIWTTNIQIFTMKRNINRCISSRYVTTILLRMLNTGPPVWEYPFIPCHNPVSRDWGAVGVPPW